MTKSLFPATLLALALVGCGDNSSAPAPSGSTPSATPAPAANPTPPAAPAAANAQDVTAAMKLEADKLLGDAQTYVKDHKWELADQAVTRLDAMKPNLPPEYAPRIDQLKQGLAAAKGAANALNGLTPPK